MSPAGAASSLSIRLYRLALLAFPRRLRKPYAGQMLEAFESALAVRRRFGSWAAGRYTLRAIADAIATGLRERFRPGSVTAPTHQSPLGRLVRWSVEMLHMDLWYDLRHSLRGLRKTPLFTLTVLAVLALGIGVNGAIFAAIEATLLVSPPYPAPDRLVVLDLTLESPTGTEARTFPWSYPKYLVMRDLDLDDVVESMAPFAVRTATLTGRGEPSRLELEVVGEDYFRVVGLPPALGRDFSAADAESERAVVLSHAVWRDRFGSDESIVGTQTTVNGEPMVVVGVAPPGFRGLSGEAQAWVPIPAVGPVLGRPGWITNPESHWLQVLARMAEGAGVEEVADRMRASAASVEEAYPWDDPNDTVAGGARSLEEARRNPMAQQAVLVLAVAAGLVLLIACANLAALMLARSLERRRETAVRLALGSSRGRIMRTVLVETLTLSLVGAVLGIGVARLGIRGIAAAWPDDFLDGGWNLRFVDTASLSLDGRTVLYTLAIGLVVGLLFGIAPARRLARSDLSVALAEGGRGSRGTDRVGGRLLVVAEIAVALTLTVGAGVMIASMGQLVAVDPGFRPDRLLTFEYSIPRSSPAAEDPLRFHEAYLERASALPGVVAAADGCVPFTVHCWITGVRRAGDRTFAQGEEPGIGVQIVDPAFRETLGIPLLSGRWLSDTDDAEGRPGVVISAAAARELFGEKSPLGQPIVAGVSPLSDEQPGEIVGVVGDVLFGSPEEGVMPELYLTQRQAGVVGTATVVVRTEGDPAAAVSDLRALLSAMEPDAPMYGVTTIRDLAARQVSDTRALATLLTLFAGLALLLSAVGVWGIVAYSVSHRRRELGIRMALGAETGRVIRMVVRRGVADAALGVALGLGVAWLGAGLLRGLLFEVEARDPTIILGGAALLLALALLASWLPARRISGVDPMEAVRTD